MIKKWTITLSPQARKRIGKDLAWRGSKGLAKAVQLPGTLVSRLLSSGLDQECALKDDEEKWGTGLVKCFYVGWNEHRALHNAFHRGRRITAYIDGNVPKGGTKVTIMFYGKDEKRLDASWRLDAVFTGTGELGGLSAGGGSLPQHWLADS